jgi:hypothetical protein
LLGEINLVHAFAIWKEARVRSHPELAKRIGLSRAARFHLPVRLMDLAQSEQDEQFNCAAAGVRRQ